MIRLGLIGCGEHSEGGHAVPLARYKADHPGEIELAAACDPRLERAQFFCTNYGFQNAYRDMDEMLARHQLDACIAVVPVEKIPKVGIQLLERRMACSVEKPLGASLSGVQGLYDSARATRTPNMVSVNRRFMPFLNRALDWARQAGPLRYVRCTFTRHARSEPEFLWGTAVHAVDAAGVHPLLLAIGSERYVPYVARTRPRELLTQANAILGQGQLSLAKYLFIVAHEDRPDCRRAASQGQERHACHHTSVPNTVHMCLQRKTRTAPETDRHRPVPAACTQSSKPPGFLHCRRQLSTEGPVRSQSSIVNASAAAAEQGLAAAQHDRRIFWKLLSQIRAAQHA
jgi:hypothetical protein